MSGGGGKGGKNTTEQTSRAVNQVSPFQEALGMKNVLAADAIAGMGPVRSYGGTATAFTPMTEASFQNVADTASAFGLNVPDNVMAGMPEKVDLGGGVMGYKAAPMVDQMLSELQMNAPGQYAEMTGMYMDPITGERPTTGPFAEITPGILNGLMNEYNNLRIKA